MTTVKVQVPTPQFFWPHKSEPPQVSWNVWLMQLELFFDLTDSNNTIKLTSTQKNQLFMGYLGAEGLRQFNLHPVAAQYKTTPFDDYLIAAKTIFGRTVNPIRGHFEFNSRKQGPNESVQDYILALRTLMADCDFHGKEDYHLAVQLAFGCYNQDAQQRLLIEPKIKLDVFQNILEAQESSSQDTTRMRGGPQIAAAYQKRSRADNFNKPNQRQNRQPQQQQYQPGPQLSCTGCGRKGHSYKDMTCPALEKKCPYCQNKGHIEACCRIKQKVQNGRHRPLSFKALHIGTFSSSATPSFVTTVQLEKPNGHFMDFTADADSCSDLTGITHSMYKADFSNLKLVPQMETIKNFDGSKITGILGSFDTTVKYADRQKKLTLYVLPDTFGPVIGKNLIFGLNIVLDPAHHIRLISTDQPATTKANEK